MSKTYKNRGLKKFYDKVYAKGEWKHYTQLIACKNSKLPTEEMEVLRAVVWKDKEVLDVGCGTGRICHAIALHGAKTVTGIDFSRVAVKEAQATYRLSKLSYRCETLQSHKGRYDIIVSIGTLEHMDDPLSALKRMKKMLKPGGIIVLSCPNWTNPRGYILQTLLHLFDAPITLADLHYLTPVEFIRWAKELKMSLKWYTFNFSWAHGEQLIADFTRRLPNVFRDMKWRGREKKIERFIKWIGDHILPFDHSAKWSGALGLYILRSR